MKVKFTKEMKEIIPVSLVSDVQSIICEMKEDNDTSYYGRMAAKIASGIITDFEILRFEAMIAKNCRVYNRFTDTSNDLDVWFDIYAYNRFEGFYEIGVYLTDLWSYTGENAAEIKSHMYIKSFTK